MANSPQLKADFINKMNILLKKGNKAVTNCHQLKMLAQDSKLRMTDMKQCDTMKHGCFAKSKYAKRLRKKEY